MPRSRPLEAPPPLEQPEPAATAAPAAVADSRVRRAIRVLGLRRRFLIDHRSQLRAGVMITGTVLILLVLLNVSLHASRQQATASVVAEAPEVASLLQSQNRLEFSLVLAASVVFLAGVFVVSVLETHKTAGAAFNLERHMSEIVHGQYNTRIRLRRDDNLKQLQRTFNQMSQALRQRAEQDLELLEQFADQVENLTGPLEAEDLARVIRNHAEVKRRLTS